MDNRRREKSPARRGRGHGGAGQCNGQRLEQDVQRLKDDYEWCERKIKRHGDVIDELKEEVRRLGRLVLKPEQQEVPRDAGPVPYSSVTCTRQELKEAVVYPRPPARSISPVPSPGNAAVAGGVQSAATGCEAQSAGAAGM